jgi:hypothetical protein
MLGCSRSAPGCWSWCSGMPSLAPWPCHQRRFAPCLGGRRPDQFLLPGQWQPSCGALLGVRILSKGAPPPRRPPFEEGTFLNGKPLRGPIIAPLLGSVKSGQRTERCEERRPCESFPTVCGSRDSGAQPRCRQNIIDPSLPGKKDINILPDTKGLVNDLAKQQQMW